MLLLPIRSAENKPQALLFIIDVNLTNKNNEIYIDYI